MRIVRETGLDPEQLELEICGASAPIRELQKNWRILEYGP